MGVEDKSLAPGADGHGSARWHARHDARRLLSASLLHGKYTSIRYGARTHLLRRSSLCKQISMGCTISLDDPQGRKPTDPQCCNWWLSLTQRNSKRQWEKRLSCTKGTPTPYAPQTFRMMDCRVEYKLIDVGEMLGK
ncbi:hypothetical protein CEXT_34991 [Caerostris extrusa]|uniref:Uncharacterized protein n=1 Tax=Caerostris extrusa TaxID=172846 RepID=A0AAV4SLE7_CAEEX|nr:hypothetical protein CEXT_34991 [Caerostris extrusa]